MGIARFQRGWDGAQQMGSPQDGIRPSSPLGCVILYPQNPNPGKGNKQARLTIQENGWSNSQVMSVRCPLRLSPPPPIMLKKKERRAAEAALDAKVLAAMEDVRRAYESRFFRAHPPHPHPLVIPR